MRFIDGLCEGETIRNVYLCKGKRSAETRNGKPYDNLILQDKTGTLDGKVWDPNSQGIADYDEKDFIEVFGDVINYNGNLQLNIRQIRKAEEGEVNRQIAADNKLLKEIKARITRLYRWSKAEAEKPQTQQSSLTALWEAQQQLNAPRTRTGKIRALQESAALFSFLQANGIQSMQQLHEKIADMNSRYYDLRGKIVKAERRIAILTERGEMWEQYNQYKSIHKQLAKVKPEKREQFEQRHSRELILYDAVARYLKELKDSGEGITPKAWQREIDQLTAGKQTDTLAMKSMREDLKAVERLRKTAEQLSRQERDKPHDREPDR